MTAARRFEALVQGAEAQGALGDWEASGRLWLEAGDFGVEHGAREPARACYAAAGDCFRRDDRPGSAARALRLAMALGDSGAAAVTLAAVVAELGDPQGGLVLVREALGGGLNGWARFMAFDTLASLGHQLGDEALWDEALAGLASSGDAGPASWARRFRGAEDHLLRGRFTVADGLFEGLAADLPAGAGAAGARSGLVAARARISRLRGDDDEAVQAFEAAHDDAVAANRGALAAAVLGELVVARVDAGVEALPSSLDEAMGFARERGQMGLVVDLLGARARLEAVRDPARARLLADEACAIARVAGWLPRVAALRLDLVLWVSAPPPERRQWLHEAEPGLLGWLDRGRHRFLSEALGFAAPAEPPAGWLPALTSEGLHGEARRLSQFCQENGVPCPA